MAGKEQIGRKCPYCGAMVSYDEYFCRACHKRFTDLNDLDAPSSVQPEEYIVPLPKLWMTAILSCIGVGLGQFYNGDTVKGMLLFLAFIAVSFGYIPTPYHNLLYTGIWVLAAAEALYSTRQIGLCQRSYAGISYPLYALLGLFALVAGLYAMTGEPDMAYLAKLFPAIGIWMM